MPVSECSPHADRDSERVGDSWRALFSVSIRGIGGIRCLVLQPVDETIYFGALAATVPLPVISSCRYCHQKCYANLLRPRTRQSAIASVFGEAGGRCPE